MSEPPRKQSDLTIPRPRLDLPPIESVRSLIDEAADGEITLEHCPKCSVCVECHGVHLRWSTTVGYAPCSACFECDACGGSHLMTPVQVVEWRRENGAK